MTRMPFDPQERRWLILRLVALAIVVGIHPLPFDLRRWGLVIPAHSAQTAYVVFECLQTVVFAAALFYGDMLPGVRWVGARYGRLVAELRDAPWRSRLVKPLPYVLCAGLLIWFVLASVETVVNAVPAGTPRFCAATAYFIIERVAAIATFIMIVNADDDDEPGARRRSIARSVAMLLHLGRGRAVTRAPITP